MSYGIWIFLNAGIKNAALKLSFTGGTLNQDERGLLLRRFLVGQVIFDRLIEQ